MKKIIVLILSIWILQRANAQIENPVQWNFSSKKIDSNTYEVHLTASIEGNWHLYSQTTPKGGPVATEIKFNKNPLVSINGKIKEVGKLEKHHEPLFDVEVRQFSEKVDFIQILKLKGKAKTALMGTVMYMVCDNERCLPPKTIPFKIALE